MFLNLDFGREALNEIALALDKLNTENKITKEKFKPQKHFNYKYVYESNQYCLPFGTRNPISYCRLDRLYFEIFYNAEKDNHPFLISEGIEKAIDDHYNDCDPQLIISDHLFEWVTTLVLNYNKVLEVTKQRDWFQGIYDEEKLIINHMNRYSQILRSDNLQIDLCKGLLISKEISDMFLKILLLFLNERLKLLNPSVQDFKDSSTKKRSSYRFIWNGEQKELCELIVELQQKGWIDEPAYGDLNSAGQAICNLFDLSKTKKNEKTNPINSFCQIYKGDINRRTNAREYKNIFKETYSKKFSKIELNPATETN